jgi:glutathione S-transferase
VFGVLEFQPTGKYTAQPKSFLAGNREGKYLITDMGTGPRVKGWECGGFQKKEMEHFPHLLGCVNSIAQRAGVKRGIGEEYIQS